MALIRRRSSTDSPSLGTAHARLDQIILLERALKRGYVLRLRIEVPDDCRWSQVLLGALLQYGPYYGIRRRCCFFVFVAAGGTVDDEYDYVDFVCDRQEELVWAGDADGWLRSLAMEQPGEEHPPPPECHTSVRGHPSSVLDMCANRHGVLSVSDARVTFHDRGGLTLKLPRSSARVRRARHRGPFGLFLFPQACSPSL